MTIDQRKSIFAYPWDIYETGVREFLIELSATGLNDVTVAAAYHGGKVLRPRGPAVRLSYAEDGCVYFRHRPDRYQRLAPTPAPGLQEQDVIDQLANSTATTTAWVVVTNNSRLGRTYPDTCMQTPFGDPVLDGLCPAHPEVRAYARSLCADITETYRPDTLLLESIGFKPLQAGSVGLRADIETNEWLLGLMGLCFCAHCQERCREIDVSDLQYRIRQSIISACEAGVRPDCASARSWLAADVFNDPDLLALLAARQRTVTSLLSEIRDAISKDCDLRVICSQREPAASGWLDGMSIPALTSNEIGLEAMFYGHSNGEIADAAWDIRRRAGPQGSLGGIIKLSDSAMGAPDDLTQALRHLRSADFCSLSFYNYGRMPALGMSRIAEALEEVSVFRG